MTDNGKSNNRLALHNKACHNSLGHLPQNILDKCAKIYKYMIGQFKGFFAFVIFFDFYPAVTELTFIKVHMTQKTDTSYVVGLYLDPCIIS
jgi:hypothetical protein